MVPLAWSREAELKHARVCMLAVAGWVAVDLGFRVPFAPEVSSLYAHDAAVEKGPMLGMLIPIAAIEVLAIRETRLEDMAGRLSEDDHVVFK